MLAYSTVNGGQIGQLLDEYAQLVNPVGESLTWADLDRYMWNCNSRTTQSFSNRQTNHRGSFHATPYLDSRRGGGWIRTLDSPDFEGTQQYILEYLTDVHPNPNSWFPDSGDQLGYGYNSLWFGARDSRIPDTPTITYTGEGDYPIGAIRFQSSAFSDPQGNDSFAAMQ